jgi:hypothetical protein
MGEQSLAGYKMQVSRHSGTLAGDVSSPRAGEVLNRRSFSGLR